MINPGMYSSATPEWETPQDFFDSVNAIFNFNVDVCATELNAKCANYYTKIQDGLAQNWDDSVAWMNPPYGRSISHWVKKASESKGIVVGLLPSRTDTAWYHNFVKDKAEIIFVRGRLKFGDGKNSAPFGSILAIWWNGNEVSLSQALAVQEIAA